MHHRQLPIPTELWLYILDHVLDVDHPRTTARILGVLEASCRRLSELVRCESIQNRFWKIIWSTSCSQFPSLQNEIEQGGYKRTFLLWSLYLSHVRTRSAEISTNSGFMEEWKITIMGDEQVGKTSIISQYVQGIILDSYEITISEDPRKMVLIDGKTACLTLLDMFTASYEEYFDMMVQAYVKAVDAFIYVVAVNDERSLKSINRWMQTIYNVRDYDNIPVIFAINKMDESGHLVTKDEIRDVLFRYPFVNYLIIETSAKTRENIELLFTETVRTVKRSCNLDMAKLIRFILKNDKKVLQKEKKPCCIM